MSNGDSNHNITSNKTSLNVRKRKSAMIKQLERRKQVHGLICAGYRNWEMASMVNVSEKTIREDLAWIFDQTNPENERNRMQEQTDWAIKEAYRNYQEEEDPDKKREWLNQYNQIQRTKYGAMRRADQINIISAEKVQLNTVIGELIRLQEGDEEEEKEEKVEE